MVVVVVLVATVVDLVEVEAVAVTVAAGRGKLDMQKDEAGAKPASGAAMRAGRPPAHRVLGGAAKAATLVKRAAQDSREVGGDMMLYRMMLFGMVWYSGRVQHRDSWRACRLYNELRRARQWQLERSNRRRCRSKVVFQPYLRLKRRLLGEWHLDVCCCPPDSLTLACL